MADKAFDSITKDQIVATLQSLGAEVNPNANKKVLYDQLLELNKSAEIEVKKEPEEEKSDTAKILEAVTGLATTVGKLDKRLTQIETGGKDNFKGEARPEDIATANTTREKIDPRIADIVERTLGSDFGIESEGFNDRPGILVTINVPRRLSEIRETTRPVKDVDTGEYKFVPGTEKKNLMTGQTEGIVLEELYWPGDRRSVTVGSSQSYDVIQAHCNRVRANIVTTYEKMKKPIPEFKLKLN